MKLLNSWPEMEKEHDFKTFFFGIIKGIMRAAQFGWSQNLAKTLKL